MNNSTSSVEIALKNMHLFIKICINIGKMLIQGLSSHLKVPVFHSFDHINVRFQKPFTVITITEYPCTHILDKDIHDLRQSNQVIDDQPVA